MLVADDGRAGHAAPRHDTGPGTLFGPYRLEGRIATGGMGEIHRAVDTRYGRTVALKLLPESLARDAGFRERFGREAHLTASLHEPHVVPIHGFGLIDDRPYLDMRLIDGEDLGAVLRRHTRLDPARAVHLVEQVAQALDAAHEQGLVHRDVKPSNVIVTPTGFAYLVDFGIAHAMGSTPLTATGAVIGTMDYMAPERFAGAPVRPSADVYALACVLYECLVGRAPFPAHDVPAAVRAHLHAPPPRPSAVDPGLPPALDAVVAVGMAKDESARFARAGDLAAAARRAVEGAPAAPPAPARATRRRTNVLPDPLPSDRHHVAPTPVTAPGPSGLRWAALTALAAVAVVLAALAAIVVVARESGPPTAAAGTPAPVTATGVADPAPEPEPASPTGGAGRAGRAVAAAEAVDTVRDYYTLVPAHLDEAWTFIGPTLRTRGGGVADYREHWAQYSRVVVQDVRASGPGSVRVTILLLTDGSARTTETHGLRLVRDRTGRPVIDADALEASSSR